MIEVILFDVGGTLIHVDRRFVIKRLNELGVAANEDDFLRAHAVGVREVSRIMRSSEPGTDATRWQAYCATLLRELRVGDDAALGMIETIAKRHNEGKLWSLIEPGTAETLQQLKSEGYRLGVVSNSDGRIKQFLDNAKLSSFFDVVVDSGAVGIEKPDPGIFQIACQRMRAAPDTTMYVGDIYEIDMIGAKAAGLTGVLLFGGEKDPAWDCAVIAKLSDIHPVLRT